MRTLNGVCGATTLLAFLLGAGCFRAQEVPWAMDMCVKARGQPLTTPALVGRGNLYLDSALRAIARPGSFDWQRTMHELQQSNDCFGRALRLAPNSYEAQLGLGVAQLAQARFAVSEPGYRRSLLQGARRLLGRAYMLRHGAYEPLYYLAEVAAAEEDFALARRLLAPLRSAAVKEGPVNMLLGYLSEQEGDKAEAVAFYRKAAAVGFPVETSMFVLGRLRWLDDDRRSR
jgi:tetratricopeptide (TPR) repeat protein